MASLKITSPAEGATVSGVVHVAIDAVGVQRVNVYVDAIDSAHLRARDAAPPFGYDWYTTRFPDGPHTVYVVSGSGKVRAERRFVVANSVDAESPDNTVVVGPGSSIVGKDGHRWEISAGGFVRVDGVDDTTTGQVTRLAYEGGKVWQEAGPNRLWWWKTIPSDGWQGGAGITQSPIPGETPKPTRVWITQSGNVLEAHYE